ARDRADRAAGADSAGCAIADVLSPGASRGERGASGTRLSTTAPGGVAVACFLPSGLSPSVLEFHQVNRHRRPGRAAAFGSRIVTARSDIHSPRSTPSALPTL